MTDLGDLSGGPILVTGAGRGLGRATAATLAAAGAVVHVADIDAGRVAETVEDLRAEGADPVGHTVDVSDEASVAAMFDAIDTPLWGLVNNAAMADAVGGASFWSSTATPGTGCSP